VCCVLIRAATPDDWPSIWPIIREIVAAGESYAYDEDLTSAQASDLWMEDPPGATVVAVAGDAILGTAKMGPNRPGRGSHVATASFMVDPGAVRRGVGRALGEHTLDWAREHGYRGMQFNAVVESNVAAVALWTALGFEVIGTVPQAFAHPTLGLVGLHVMYRDL
jgi:GNAT superfamily N-acetyltransferase